MSIRLTLNNTVLPSFSLSFLAILGLFYIGVVALHFLNGYGDSFQLAGIPAAFVTALILMKSTTRLVKYSSYPDYLEFASANLLIMDSLSFKRRSQRLVKSHIEEITVKGYFLWKRIDVKLKSTSGRRYSAVIPLRFVTKNTTARILEDLAGTSLEEMWEADYARDSDFAQHTQTVLSGS